MAVKLLIPTGRSGMTRRSRSGRPVGPLQVNPSVWSLAREGPATGSPNHSWGGCAAWAPLLPDGSFLGSDLLPRQRGGGSGMVPHPPGHDLLKSS